MSAAFMALYPMGAANVSIALVELMMTTDPCPDFLRWSISASQPRTVCSTSISKSRRQCFSLSMPAPPLRHGTQRAHPPPARPPTHDGYDGPAPAERGGGTPKPAGVSLGIADIEGFSDGRYPARRKSTERLLHLVLGSRAQTDVDPFAGQEIDDGAPDP